MKKEEKIAENFLLKQGYVDIVFEPLGLSMPPDFSIEGEIGIEVRRLNKHMGHVSKPIEKLEFNLVPKFRKLLLELENPELAYSVGVTLRYKRPLTVSKNLLDELKKSIRNSTQLELFKSDIVFSDKLTYVLWKGNGKSNQTYELRTLMDFDKGGDVTRARYEALKIAIEEKNRKLKHLKSSYEKFWLILIDNIFSIVDETTKIDLASLPEIKSMFSRIILISKTSPYDWVDIYPWNN